MTKAVRRPCCFLLFFSLLIVSICQAASPTDGTKAPLEQPKILVLDAYPRGMPIPESVNRGILAVLKEKGFSVADVFMENLDSARIQTSEHRINVVNLLRHKLGDKRVEIVITIGPLATDFIAEEGKELFPDATVLALVSPNYQVLSPAYVKVMNIPWQDDPAGTLEVALGLFPGTRQVFVVTGANDRILPFLDEAKQAFEAWEGRLSFEYSNKMTYEEMLLRVASLPKNAIVIYAPYFSDSTGRTYVPAEVVINVCQVANRPVFATLEEYLGSGIVGGSLLRTENLGKNAALIALDYLSGQLKLTEPVTTFASSHRVAFDWRELMRWEVNHLPRSKDSIIINRPQELWGQYKILVMAVVTFILFLTALIIALSLLNRRLKQAKEEAIASEERFREMIERAPEAIILYDMDLKRIVQSNPKAEQLLGCSRDKLLQGGLDRFYSKDQTADDDVAASMNRNLSKAMAGEELAFEQFFRSDDGRDLVCKVRFVKLPYKNKQLLRGSFVDITARKRAQHELEISRAEFAAIFKAIPDGVVFVDPRRHIVRINPAFTRMFGYQLDEIAGQTTELIYANPDHYLKQGQARFNPEPKENQPLFENEYRRKDGSTFPGNTLGVHVVDEAGKLLGYVGIIHDVTERLNAEQERLKLENLLRQSQKMEAIGTMAGGIAHDFNNLLTIIGGNLEMVQVKLPSGTPVDGNLEDIRQASDRAKALVSQILAFSRQEKQLLVPTDLSSLTRESLKLLRPMIPTTVEIVSEIPEKPITINADKTQLHQVLINLCSNAIHAMDEKGLLRIRLEAGDCKTFLAPNVKKLQNGQCAKLSVVDIGKGMDPKTVGRIFDPFYTTKDVGLGTGMGLSVVHGIIEQHSGFIAVESSPGQGTTFDMYFPLVNEIESQGDSITENSPPTGSERILVVDDEEYVADVCGAMLIHLGYMVTVMTKSTAALEFFKSHPDDFDLVITDQTMPGLSGVEFVKELLRIRPDLPIILCSGYSAKVTEETAGECGIRAYCSKPMEIMKLATTARDVLDADKQPHATVLQPES